jgi:hypothetical protein
MMEVSLSRLPARLSWQRQVSLYLFLFINELADQIYW